jgi:hypothetical protein
MVNLSKKAFCVSNNAKKFPEGKFSFSTDSLFPEILSPMKRDFPFSEGKYAYQVFVDLIIVG